MGLDLWVPFILSLDKCVLTGLLKANKFSFYSAQHKLFEDFSIWLESSVPPKFLQTSETRAQFKLANLQVSQTGFNSQRHMRAEYSYQQKEKTSIDGCSRKFSIFDHKIQDSTSFNLTDISNQRISAVCQCSPEEKKKEPRWVVLTHIWILWVVLTHMDTLGSFDSWIWILWVVLLLWILWIVLTLMDTLGSFDSYGYFGKFLLTLGQFGWSGLIRQFGSLGHLDTIKNVDPQKNKIWCLNYRWQMLVLWQMIFKNCARGILAKKRETD